jgi:hypothetical protein
MDLPVGPGTGADLSIRFDADEDHREGARGGRAVRPRGGDGERVIAPGGVRGAHPGEQARMERGERRDRRDRVGPGHRRRLGRGGREEEDQLQPDDPPRGIGVRPPDARPGRVRRVGEASEVEPVAEPAAVRRPADVGEANPHPAAGRGGREERPAVGDGQAAALPLRPIQRRGDLLRSLHIGPGVRGQERGRGRRLSAHPGRGAGRAGRPVVPKRHRAPQRRGPDGEEGERDEAPPPGPARGPGRAREAHRPVRAGGVDGGTAGCGVDSGGHGSPLDDADVPACSIGEGEVPFHTQPTVRGTQLPTQSGTQSVAHRRVRRAMIGRREAGARRAEG